MFLTRLATVLPAVVLEEDMRVVAFLTHCCGAAALNVPAA